MKQPSFSTNFRMAEPFNVDYVICFYNSEKELNSAIFNIKILAAEIFRLGHSYLILRSAQPARIVFFRTNNAAPKSNIICIIFLYEKLKNYSIQSFKECLFFVFCLFCLLLLLSNSTLYVMFVCFF